MAHLGLSPHDMHGVVLLRDCLEAQGAFLLAQLIKVALAGGPAALAAADLAAAPLPDRRLVLLAAQQSASHYAQVLRKAGLQVPALLASGQISVIDLLPSLGRELQPLQALHQQVAAAVAAAGDGGSGGGIGGSSNPSCGVCLVADDLTVLRCLAQNQQDWRAFLHSCIALGQAPGCGFIGLAHGDVAEDEGWLAALEHAATLVVEMEPLERGRPASSTGKLVITRRDTTACFPLAVPAAVLGAVRVNAELAPPGSCSLGFRLSEAGPVFLSQQQQPHIL